MNKKDELGPAPTPEPVSGPTTDTQQQVLSALAARERATTIAELARVVGAHPNTLRTTLADLVAAGLVERTRLRQPGRGRPAHGFAITAQGRRTLPTSAAFREYRSLTQAFVAHLSSGSSDSGSDARAIGRTWGHSLASDRRLAGNEPDPHTGGEPEAAGSEPAARTGGEPGEPLVTSGREPDTGTTAETAVGEDRDAPDRRVIALLADLGFGPATDDDGIGLYTCPLLDLAKEMPEVICQVHQGLVEGALDTLGGPADEVHLMPFAEPGACRLRLHGSATDSRVAGSATRTPTRRNR